MSTSKQASFDMKWSLNKLFGKGQIQSEEVDFSHGFPHVNKK